MRKKFLFLFCTLFLLGVMAGCSEDPKEELESYQKDFRENVIEPVHEINLELTTALNSFNDGDANDEEVVLSLNEDLLNLIEEKREYLADMKEPESEAGAEYYEALVSGANALFDYYEKSSELIEALADGTTKEMTEAEKGTSDLARERKEKEDVIRKLQEKFEEEFEVEFESGRVL